MNSSLLGAGSDHAIGSWSALIIKLPMRVLSQFEVVGYMLNSEAAEVTVYHSWKRYN